MASSSNEWVTHPPRSNPPLRSSSGPPSPCITPSTVTIVVVVSFMIAVPFSLGRPRGRPLTSATNTSAPIRHRRLDFLRGLSGTPVVSDPTARRFGATALHFLMCASSADELWDQIDREDPD